MVFTLQVHVDFLSFIEVSSVYYWSDSMLELPWVYGNGKPSNTYVRERLDVVQNLVDVTCWHYVESMEICSTQQTFFLGTSYSQKYCGVTYGFKDHITFSR